MISYGIVSIGLVGFENMCVGQVEEDADAESSDRRSFVRQSP